MDLEQWALMRPTITTAISFAAFILSVGQLLYSLMTSRRAITIRILEYCPREEATYFLVSVENRSRLPIAITRIILDVDAGVDCAATPKWIGTERHTKTEHLSDGNWTKIVDGEYVRYSLALPICLPSLGAVSGDVWFDVGKASLPLDATHLNFRVHTNRGRLRKRRLLLPVATLSHISSQ